MHSSGRALEILEDINLYRDSTSDIEILWAPPGKDLCYDNKIWVDMAQNDPRNTAVAVGHEISHLMASVTGACADWRSMTREEYVQVSTDEEINAHAASYVIHMQATRESSISQSYRRNKPVAFDDFQNWRRTIPADQQGTWDDIEELAKDWVEDQYRSGAWVMATTGQNYYHHFAQRYDDLRRGRAVETGNTHSSPAMLTVSQAARFYPPGNGVRNAAASPPSRNSAGPRSYQGSSPLSRGEVSRPKSPGK
ncbi:hypothetical protein ACWGJ2_30700 [Streptomyces sp. NPDC054796]